MWVLLFAKQAVKCVLCGDAESLRDTIEFFCQGNPWTLGDSEGEELLRLGWEVKNLRTNSQIAIVSSSAPNYSKPADLVICEGLTTHWRVDLWRSIFSGVARRPRTVLMVVCGAGVLGEWPHKVRETIRADKNWFFSRVERPCSSQATPALLQEQKHVLEPVDFAQLFMNEWVGPDDTEPEPPPEIVRSEHPTLEEFGILSPQEKVSAFRRLAQMPRIPANAMSQKRTAIMSPDKFITLTQVERIKLFHDMGSGEKPKDSIVVSRDWSQPAMAGCASPEQVQEPADQESGN
jgi:hypothetical protein